MEAQRVHLNEHLDGEENHEEEVCDLLEVVKPLWLAVVLGGEYDCVKEDKDDDEPEHGLRLDRAPAVSPRFSVPPAGNILQFNLYSISSVS